MLDAETNRLVRQAIRERRLVRFELHGLVRIAEPHDYGVKNNTPQLLVYQVGGASRSGRLPNWRRINLLEVSGLTILDQRFGGGRSTPTGKHSEWDELLMRVGSA